MFSYHTDVRSLGQGQCYLSGWREAGGNSVEFEMDRLIKGNRRFATSPIVFRRGVRREDHFLSSDWVALDFDRGLTLGAGMTTFAGMVHLIGTTKSHQLPKGDSPPCDRFRVWLKTKHTITRPEIYKATIRSLVATYGADPACVGAAQLFWPLTAICSVASRGETIPVVEPEKPRLKPHLGEYNGKIPPWVRDWLNGIFKEYEEHRRNELVFKTAVEMAKNGWDEGQIVYVVMGSKLPKEVSPRVLDEVKRAVRSGVARAQEEKSPRNPADA